MTSNEDPASGSWHLDKRVPIAVIILLSGNIAATAWWAAGVSSRLDHVERQITLAAPQADRLTRLEVHVETIRETANRIERMIRREAPP